MCLKFISLLATSPLSIPQFISFRLYQSQDGVAMMDSKSNTSFYFS